MSPLSMLPTSLAEQAVLIVLASALYCVVSNLFQSKTSVQALPVPLGAQWIWGHERTVFVREPGRAFRGWIREKGLTFRIKAAFRAPDVVVLSDPVGIAHILQKKVYDYPHSQVVRPRVARLLGKGLGWVEGETEHKRMRHMVTPPFSHENIRAMSQDIAAASMQIVDDLTLEVQGSSKDSSYNALEWTAKAT